MINWFKYFTGLRKDRTRQLKYCLLCERNGGGREGRRRGEKGGKWGQGRERLREGKKKEGGGDEATFPGCRARNKSLICTRTAWSFAHRICPGPCTLQGLSEGLCSYSQDQCVSCLGISLFFPWVSSLTINYCSSFQRQLSNLQPSCLCWDIISEDDPEEHHCVSSLSSHICHSKATLWFSCCICALVLSPRASLLSFQ